MTEEFAALSSRDGPSNRHFVAFRDLVVNRKSQVRKCGANAADRYGELVDPSSYDRRVAEDEVGGKQDVGTREVAGIEKLVEIAPREQLVVGGFHTDVVCSIFRRSAVDRDSSSVHPHGF